MKKESTVKNVLPIEEFHMPRYAEIPNVGLYLKQVVRLINDALEPYFDITVTETMLSNYVKMHLVSNPVKKQYDRDQIGALIFITIAKTVVSLDNLQTLLKMQAESYSTQNAYDYFCTEFETVLQTVYGTETTPPSMVPLMVSGTINKDIMVSGTIKVDTLKSNDTIKDTLKQLLRSVIITAAHQFYLDRQFAELNKGETNET